MRFIATGTLVEYINILNQIIHLKTNPEYYNLNNLK